MKRFLLGGLLLALGTAVLAQNPRGTAKSSDGAVSVDYGRPSAKGRDVFGMIESGTSWRMGADQATTLTTTKDLTFGTTKVAKGTYTLEAYFADKEKWSLVVSKDGSKVAEVPGKLEKGQPAVEQMTIDLTSEAAGSTFVLSWGTYKLSAPFKIG